MPGRGSNLEPRASDCIATDAAVRKSKRTALVQRTSNPSLRWAKNLLMSISAWLD